MGERGYRLSGGEKQRLAIARVILKDPQTSYPHKKFLGVKMIDINGERCEVVRSTTELKKAEFFERYVEPIRVWYAGFGGYIPDPHEVSPEVASQTNQVRRVRLYRLWQANRHTS